jgi:hypothetical protein
MERDKSDAQAHDVATCLHCRRKYPRVEYHTDHKRVLHSQYSTSSTYYGAWEGEDGAAVWVKQSPPLLTTPEEIEAELAWQAHVQWQQEENRRYWESDEGKAHRAFMATVVTGKYA